MVLIIAFQVSVVEIVLINLSFWNEPTILRIKLMKESLICQIMYIQKNIQIAKHLQMQNMHYII